MMCVHVKLNCICAWWSWWSWVAPDRAPACGRLRAGGALVGGAGCDVGRYLNKNAIAVLADGCFDALEKMKNL